MLSNIASRSEWNKGAKLASHAAFALTNPGGFAGGVLGFIPKMSFSKGMRTTANIGAIVGFGGYAMTHLNNPLLSPIYGDFSNTTKITSFIGTHDILYPSTIKFDEMLEAQNADIITYVYPKMNHIFMFYPIPEAKDVINTIINIISPI